MLVENTDKPTMGETYASAVGNGSTRVGNDSSLRTSGDVIAAAGMSTYRMGLSLMRLMSEWQAGATPARAEAPELKVLAQEMAARRVEEDIDHARHKVSEKRAMRAAVKVQKSDIDLAHAEMRLLDARSANWSLHENKLRFQRLKTLPEVRAALEQWVMDKGWVEERWAGVQQLVADTLRHFLAPKCPVCKGRGNMVVPGTSRAVGRECRKCRGTGDQDLQHGGRGRVLLAHILACTGQASNDLHEGQYKRRSRRNEEDRERQRHHQQIERLQRADAEGKADAAADTAAIAAKFATSLGERRKAKP